MLGLLKVKKHLKNGLKIKDWEKGEEEDDLIDYSVTLSNGHCIEWSVSPGFNTSIISDTDSYLSDKSNHMDTPPKNKEMIKDFEKTLEDFRSMLSEGLKVEKLKELSKEDKDYREGYQIFDVLLNDNLTRFVFAIEQGDIEKISKLSQLVQEYHSPFICNLVDGKFELLGEKENPPPSPQKEDEEHNALVKDLKNMLSEGYEVRQFKIETHIKPIIYQVVLTDRGETTYTFDVEPSDSEKRTELESIIHEHYKPNKDMFPSTCSPAPLNIDAPFYQGMTKEEVVESLVRCIYGGGSSAEHFLTKNKVFVHGSEIVVEGLVEGKNKGIQQFYRYDQDMKGWVAENEPLNVDFYQGMTKEEAIVSLAKNVYGYSCTAAYFLTIYNVFIHGSKLIVEPVASGGRYAYFYDKEKRAWEAQNPAEKKELEEKAAFEQPQLTAQDLIQAAKDELIGDLTQIGSACSSLELEEITFVKRGFAECIRFMEQLLKK